MNKQRESVYTLRREILEGRVHLTEEEIVDTREYMLALGEEILEDQVDRFAGKRCRSSGVGYSRLSSVRCRACSVSTRQELERLKLDEKNTDEITDTIWALAKAGVRGEGKGRRCRSFSAGSSATSCFRLSTPNGRITSIRSTT